MLNLIFFISVQRAAVVSRGSPQVQKGAEGVGGEPPQLRVLAGARLAPRPLPLPQL